jgi:hypothetical protein
MLRDLNTDRLASIVCEQRFRLHPGGKKRRKSQIKAN